MKGDSLDLTRGQLLALALVVEGGLGALAVVLGLFFGLPVGEWFKIGWLEVGMGVVGVALRHYERLLPHRVRCSRR